MNRNRFPKRLFVGLLALAFFGVLLGAGALVLDWRGGDTLAVAKTALYTESEPTGMDRDDGRTTNFQPGDEVYYKIVFKQTTPKVRATNVFVTDDVPEGLRLAFGGVRILPEETHLTDPGVIPTVINYDGNHWDFTVNSMSENDYVTCVVHCTVLTTCEDPQINLVSAQALGSDDYGPVAETGFGKTEKVEDDELINIVHPRINIEKTVDREWVQSTDEVVYTLTLTETVPGAALNMPKIEDHLPEGLTPVGFDSITLDGNDWMKNHQNDEWYQIVHNTGNGQTDYDGFSFAIHRLEYGQTFVAKIRAKVDEGVHGGILDNVAIAYSDNPGTPQVEDNAEVPVVQPVLTIEKTDDANPFASQKDGVNYKVRVKQVTEHAEAREFWIEDELPPEIHFDGTDALTIMRGTDGSELTAATDAHATYDEAAAKWRIEFDNPLQYNEVVEVTFPVTVDANASYDFHTNYASTGAFDTDTQEDDEPFMVPEPGLHLMKVVNDDDGYVQTGDRVSYDVTFWQSGANSNSKDVVVVDTPPEGVEIDFDTVTIEGLEDIEYTLTAPNDTNGWTVNIPSMPDGTYATVHYEANITKSGDKDGELTNIATIDDGDGNHDEAETTLKYGSPDLAITKVIENAVAPVERGASFDYVIEVTNTDESLPARNVVTTDKLPTGVRSDGTPTISYPDGREIPGAQMEFGDFGIRWTVPELGPGEIIHVRIQAHVADDAPDGGIVNWARTQGENIYWEDGDQDVERLDADGNPVEPGTEGSSLFKRASADISTYQPVITIEKSHEGGPFHPGELVTYTVKVRQTTPDASAKDVVVTDIVPEGLTVAGGIEVEGVTGAAWELTESGYVVRIPTLSDVDTCSIKYQAQVDPDIEPVPTDLKNVVSAVAQGVPRVTADDTVKVVKLSNPVPDMTITKTADVDEVKEGDLVAYTVDLTETVDGTSATNVTMKDPIPDGLILWHEGMNERLARATRDALRDQSARLMEPKAWMTSKGVETALDVTVADDDTILVDVGTLGYGDHAYLQFVCVADDVDDDEVITNVVWGLSPSVPHDVTDDVDVRVLDVEEEPVVPDPVEPNPPANKDVDEPATTPEEVVQDLVNQVAPTPIVSKLAQTGLPALGIGLLSCAAIAVAVFLFQKVMSRRDE